ncbi:MAG: N-6 DNA methylase, partial [Desulfovibrionaceae bacterium]|nr:N-6 DNA methylase [Desulfovibrionaceae bacterium]
IFEGESYIEFAVLWMVCHCTRVHTDGQPPEQCWLEKWQKQSQSVAVAALDTLRPNVTRTIEALGQGFIDANAELRDKLSTGTLGVQAYYHQLQRLAYRLIFLFVVEDRGLLLAPGASQASRDRYRRFYSLMHLRRLSAISKGTKHHDLWEGVKLVMSALGRPEGCAQLDILPMGGFLWSDEIMPDLQGLRLRNADLLEAIRRLAFTRYNFEMRPIDWRHLGAQELGSVYESLLELHPELTQTTFELKQVQGNDRKTTGSYYTPTQLIESLLETALDPVIDQAVRDADNPEAALLDLKICDPACGSGHFLLAAARRVAKRLAQIRTGDTEPAPAEQRRALRDVAGRCIYGIDINAMSLELCKVGLWLETHEAGKPLHFLDHHLVCANSLLGTTAEHIKKGIPAEAYAALEGDDKKACTNLKKRNAKQFEMMLSNSLLKDQFEQDLKKLAELVRTVKFDEMPADTMADMEKREEAFCNWRASAEWQKKKRLYDMWTAAFVLPRYFPQ